MDDEHYEALLRMLDSPWYKWTKACGMKRPILPWRMPLFNHYVAVTKMAIRRTLSYEFYPETYIPRVEIHELQDGWSLDVHVWGDPKAIRV